MVRRPSRFKELGNYRKVFTLANEAPTTIKPMHYARFRDPGTKGKVSLCFQSRGNRHNTFSSERNGKAFASVDEIL